MSFYSRKDLGISESGLGNQKKIDAEKVILQKLSISIFYINTKIMLSFILYIF